MVLNFDFSENIIGMVLVTGVKFLPGIDKYCSYKKIMCIYHELHVRLNVHEK